MSITHIAFYPSDWLAGTRGLTAEETGVYITLICQMYEMVGPIERDDKRLARLCGCKSRIQFEKLLEYLISEGKINEHENTLFNERVEKEIKKVLSLSLKCRSAAEARWKKKSNKINGSSYANASAMHMHGACQPEPEPEPEDIDKESISNIRRFSEDFEVWWKDEYPERKGTHSKAKARQKYIRYRKAGISREQISRVTDAYFHELQETGRLGTEFVQHATTFLNAELWEND